MKPSEPSTFPPNIGSRLTSNGHTCVSSSSFSSNSHRIAYPLVTLPASIPSVTRSHPSSNRLFCPPRQPLHASTSFSFLPPCSPSAPTLLSRHYPTTTSARHEHHPRSPTSFMPTAAPFALPTCKPMISRHIPPPPTTRPHIRCHRLTNTNMPLMPSGHPYP